MKIYLIDLGNGSHHFCPEGAASPAEGDAVQSKKLVRWFARKLENLEEVLRTSERGVGPHVHRLWEWLKRRAHADESFLRRLRLAASLEVYHPASVSESDARLRWASYLGRNRARHMFWLVVNVLICPFTLLLIPLPGPNVIGFWFVYRAIAHLLALLGVLRARRRKTETSFYVLVELDPEPGEAFPDWISRLAARHGFSSRQVRQLLAGPSDRSAPQDGPTRVRSELKETRLV